MKSVCFTGHRNFPNTQEMTARITDTLEALIAKGADTFYAGGAKGWDNDCSDIVIDLRRKYPHIKLNIVPPYPEEEQTVGWTDAEIEQYHRIISQADNVELCSESKDNGSEKTRNARLVELADVCVCFYNTRRSRSGTGQTVRMAEKKKIAIINLYK